MSTQRSNRPLARFEEAAREEAAAAARGRGRSRPAGRGCGRAPARAPPAGRGKGAALAARAPQIPVGQVEEGDDEGDNNVENNVEAAPAPQSRGRGRNNRQRAPPLPPQPNLVEVMAAQTQWLQRLTQLAEQGNNYGGCHQGPQDEGLHRKIERLIRLKAPTFSYLSSRWRTALQYASIFES